MQIKENDIKEFAENKIKALRQEIKKWETILNAIEETVVKESTQLSFLTTPPPVTKMKLRRTKKQTINQKVINVLKDANVPLTTREIMDELNRLYPGKSYTMENFSGAFSSMYRKPTSGIRQYHLKEATLEVKAVYGLVEWFASESEFKENYKLKVKERYKAI